MNPVVRFELPYFDAKRVAKFYQSACGWITQELGEEMGNYIHAHTAETDAKPGLPVGAINGELYPSTSEWPAQYPSIVIGVENIEETI